MKYTAFSKTCKGLYHLALSTSPASSLRSANNCTVMVHTWRCPAFYFTSEPPLEMPPDCVFAQIPFYLAPRWSFKRKPDDTGDHVFRASFFHHPPSVYAQGFSPVCALSWSALRKRLCLSSLFPSTLQIPLCLLPLRIGRKNQRERKGERGGSKERVLPMNERPFLSSSSSFFFFLYWGIVTLQPRVGFSCTTKWVRYISSPPWTSFSAPSSRSIKVTSESELSSLCYAAASH